jgi:hypothetical protein
MDIHLFGTLAIDDGARLLGPAGLELAERAIEHDPLNEAAYRTAMLCAYTLGRQDEALRTYRRCRQALTEELGVVQLPRPTMCMPGFWPVHRPPSCWRHWAANRNTGSRRRLTCRFSDGGRSWGASR